MRGDSQRSCGRLVGTFVVERYLAGWTAEEIDTLLARLNELTAHFESYGVRYVRSVVVPGDEVCLWLFDGPRAEPIANANESAGLPTHRVVAVVLTPDHEEH
jgi:hypothetical protein